jgi:phosphoserine phosphatase RsbU/P
MNTIEEEINQQTLNSESTADAIAAEENAASVIFRVEDVHRHGEVIYQIASDNHYVYEDTPVEMFAVQLEKLPEVTAVGVVDHDLKVKGLIIRKELFDLLGKRFGRDVFQKRPVRKVMKKSRSFFAETNIFTVSTILKEELRKTEDDYFLIVDQHEKFAGVFSTRKILLYLAELTKNDLILARTLQNSIVKEEQLLELNRFNLFSASRMAKEVGGDFYSLKEYEKDKWIIFFADVSGKGIAASLVTAVMGGMFNFYDFSQGMKSFVVNLNNYLVDTFNMERFVTGVIVDFDNKTGNCKICDMGHSYTYIKKDQEIYNLKTSDKNLPIGVMPDVDPVLNGYTLNKGETLVLITDGVMEQTDPDGEEYAFNRFKNFFADNAHEDLRTIGNKLFVDLTDFRKTQPQRDDITFLFLDYHCNE